MNATADDFLPGSRAYFEDGNGHLPNRWYGRVVHVIKRVGAFVLFNFPGEDDVYAVPEQCLYLIEGAS